MSLMCNDRLSETTSAPTVPPSALCSPTTRASNTIGFSRAGSARVKVGMRDSLSRIRVGGPATVLADSTLGFVALDGFDGRGAGPIVAAHSSGLPAAGDDAFSSCSTAEAHSAAAGTTSRYPAQHRV